MLGHMQKVNQSPEPFNYNNSFILMLISPLSLIIMNEIEMNLCLKWRLVDTISTKTKKIYWLQFMVAFDVTLQFMVAIDVTLLNQHEKLHGHVFWSCLLA